MHILDPYGYGYGLASEEITVLDPLTDQAFTTVHEIVGLPAPVHDRSRDELTLIPPGPVEAERLRCYLRLQSVRHRSTLTVSHDPDWTVPPKLAGMFALVGRSAALDEAFREAARALVTTPAETLFEGPRASIHTLYQRLGPEATQERIDELRRHHGQ
jgi:hypothetical protein